MTVRHFRRLAVLALAVCVYLAAAQAAPAAPGNFQDHLREFAASAERAVASVRPSAWRRDMVLVAGVVVFVESLLILVLAGAARHHREALRRKETEDTLEARLRQTAGALPVAIWMSDADGGWSYFNDQWLELTGRPLGQEIGFGWLDDVHPDDRDASHDAYVRGFRERQRVLIVCRIRRHDGQYRWLMISGSPRDGADGVFRGYIGGCIDVTEQMQATAVLRDVNRRLLAAQEEERRRIARELHDHVSQQLALLAIEIQQLTMAAPPSSSPDGVVARLQDAWQHASDIASDVHAIAHRLHPSKLEALGLVATMRAHCRDMSRHGLAVRFVDRSVNRIPSEAALCLFRVLEEALSNVANHSGAQDAEVTLEESDAALTLTIVDAGRGFELSQARAAGLGLVSMRERLHSFGGSLAIESAPGKGTLVEARLPIGGPEINPLPAMPLHVAETA